jgi:hypothetical protein
MHTTNPQSQCGERHAPEIMQNYLNKHIPHGEGENTCASSVVISGFSS